ncbi:MAG: MoaD/ThiS family protein [Gemmatimonadaceae bacterium]
MSITVEIPSPLRLHSAGHPTVTIDTTRHPCTSVRDLLAIMADEYPRIVDSVMTEQQELRPHVNVFVDNENTRYTQGLDTPTPNDSTVTILAAISGG